MLGDTLATLGVLCGGFLILLYGEYWNDSALTAAIAVYLFVHGYVEIRKAVHILMESAPADVDLDQMVREVEAVEAVEDMHHVHIWRLDERRVALEAHIAVNERDLASIEEIKHRVKMLLRDKFNVEHSTLEIEIVGRTGHGPEAIARE